MPPRSESAALRVTTPELRRLSKLTRTMNITCEVVCHHAPSFYPHVRGRGKQACAEVCEPNFREEWAPFELDHDVGHTGYLHATLAWVGKWSHDTRERILIEKAWRLPERGPDSRFRFHNHNHNHNYRDRFRPHQVRHHLGHTPSHRGQPSAGRTQKTTLVRAGRVAPPAPQGKSDPGDVSL